MHGVNAHYNVDVLQYHGSLYQTLVRKKPYNMRTL